MMASELMSDWMRTSSQDNGLTLRMPTFLSLLPIIHPSSHLICHINYTYVINFVLIYYWMRDHLGITRSVNLWIKGEVRLVSGHWPCLPSLLQWLHMHRVKHSMPRFNSFPWVLGFPSSFRHWNVLKSNRQTDRLKYKQVYKEVYNQNLMRKGQK